MGDAVSEMYESFSNFRSIERKYQDQVKQLQGELDKEKENFSTLTARRKQDLDAEMEELKVEEGKLREHLTQAQKVFYHILNKFVALMNDLYL